MADVRLWTFRDVIEYLIDQLDVPLTPRNERLARAAVLTAYRDLPNRTRWKCLERRAILRTTASQTTGSIAYDHTGGTYERELTLTGATWPSDAVEGRVIISDTHYAIATRESDTVVTLASNSNPGGDVASSTSYTWYRSTYALPVDFRKICRIFDVDNEHEIAMVETDIHHAAAMYFYDSPDTPWQATIRSHGDYYNSMSIEFGPPPSTSRKYDYIYEVMPRELRINKYATGTVSITAGQLSVTGSGTVFPTDCVGSIIRFGNSSNEPTSVVGGLNELDAWVDNLFAAERVIMTRSSDTAITVDSTVASTLSAVKYTVSDPIDLNISSMFTAFLRLAEAEFARLVTHEKLRDKKLDAHQAIIEAMEADQRHIYARGSVHYNRFNRVTVTTDSG